MRRIETSKLFNLSLTLFIAAFLSVPAYSRILLSEIPANAPIEVNGRILITNINSSKISVLLQIKTTTGSDALGGATMIIGFDTSAISIKTNPVKNTDYVFHNFCGGNYSPATITRPLKNRIWINVDLPFKNCNDGTIVAGGSSWTDVATIHFDVVNQTALINVYWITNSPFWGIYDDDNATTWNIGRFEDAINIPLPVELSSFKAEFFRDEVLLVWTTETEVNNYGFDVERRTNDEDWERLGFVAGCGNSNTTKTYFFKDSLLFGGSIFYYRLKQLDTDGEFVYSEIVKIEIHLSSFSLSQNHPNPFNPSTTIRYSVPQKCKVLLSVYDVLGNEVTTLVDEENEAGVYAIIFDASKYASGIYFYALRTGSFVQTKKMLMIK